MSPQFLASRVKDVDEDHVSGEQLFYKDCLGTPARSPVAPADPGNQATDNGEPGCPARTAHKTCHEGKKSKIGRARSSPKPGRPDSLTLVTDVDARTVGITFGIFYASSKES